MRALGGLADVDLARLGIPGEAAYADAYAAAAGRARPDAWPFYMALALFRIAAILQGVYKRSTAASASSLDARSVGALASRVAEAAVELI
jgi:aminoglycoside phosphotransferase (APT) family kinase protein